MASNTQKQWRVQVRKSRDHKWRNKGLFETRATARAEAAFWREGFESALHFELGFGLGNTRVVPYVRASA